MQALVNTNSPECNVMPKPVCISETHLNHINVEFQYVFGFTLHSVILNYMTEKGALINIMFSAKRRKTHTLKPSGHLFRHWFRGRVLHMSHMNSIQTQTHKHKHKHTWWWKHDLTESLFEWFDLERHKVVVTSVHLQVLSLSLFSLFLTLPSLEPWHITWGRGPY